ncbi:hypothetical protein Lal_00029211 [Lupinus albus]|nr:hypothetical protein Lal_00029211 [Lupinus albus]
MGPERIKDFNIAKTEANISTYAGYVGSSFMLGRALTSILWGKIADRYGRKPAHASELFREEHQAIGLSTITAAWGLGIIIGPALGGYLAQETLHNHNDGNNNSLDEAEALENGGGTDNDKKIRKKENLFRNWPLMLAILVYSLYTLQDTAYHEMTIATGLLLIQNRAVEQYQRGEANGIAMTSMSFVSVIGPASGGALLSWSQKRIDASFLPGTHVVFFVINILSAVSLVMLAFVRDKKKTCSAEQN